MGEFVDVNAHIVGKGLDLVGLHDAAHTVDSYGDRIADGLGAAVGELNLGQSDDPKELLHGDAKAVGETAQHLQKFAQAFEETAAGLTRLDSEHWQGQAAEAFRRKFSPQPKAWMVTGDACAAAGKALETYQGTITWAQDQAQQAIEAYNAAKKASEDARNAYNRQVSQYNSALDDYRRAASAGQNATPPAALGEFHDPGEAGLKRAQEMLRAARGQRDDAARTAAQAIMAATGSAPREPGLWDRINLDLVDVNAGATVGVVHFAGGVVKGATDLVKFARGLNPQDPYNVTHPALYLDHVNTVAAGLVHTANHPTELASAIVGSGWGKDPAETGGTAVFNLLSGLATGGGSEAAAVGGKVAIDAAAAAGERGGIRAVESAGQNAAEKAAANSAEHAGAPALNRPAAPAFDVSAFPEHVRPTEPAAVRPTAPEPAPVHAPEPAPVHSPATEPTAVHSPPPEAAPAHTPEPAPPHEPAPEHAPEHSPEPEPAPEHEPSPEHDPSPSHEHAPEHAPQPEREPPDLYRNSDPAADIRRAQDLTDMKAAEADISKGTRRMMDDYDITDFGKSWNDDVSRLPQSQKDAIDAYTEGSGQFNRSLRGQENVTAETAGRIAELDKAISVHPVPEDVVVSRGVDLGYLDMPSENMPGKTFTEPGYMSTTPGSDVPAAFRGEPAMLHLRVPAGTPALWVESAGRFGSAERELLLGRGRQWRVDKVITTADGKVHVYGEVL
ncbi:putative T7SS-secreted protein [Saccharothrix sp. ST-888]|uniref:putative T7SS-secreted protein n=1 Tax=Saccharothrix sp. ST-888 TaxID=1427391 RepID=UPI0005ECD4E3|nr:ADP-ribosyltransferase [Saccharothrix sp. ST-888]KJK57059.1 hypothetical protein UK12_18670 [Saccharothrix sp. ST-888]